MSQSTITYHGTFRGGDPRDFIPDFDNCTPEQIENWKSACRFWNQREANGEQTEFSREEAQLDAPENTAFGIGYQGKFTCGTDDE